MEFKSRENSNWITITVENAEEEAAIGCRINGSAPNNPYNQFPYEIDLSKAGLAGLAHSAMLSVDKKEIGMAKQIVEFFESQIVPQD